MEPLPPGPAVTLLVRIVSAGCPQSHLDWDLNRDKACSRISFPEQPEAGRFDPQALMDLWGPYGLRGSPIPIVSASLWSQW